MAATDVSAAPSSPRAAHGAGAAAVESPRVVAARAAARQREHRRGEQLRSVNVALVLIVAISAADARPGLGSSGRALGLTVAVAVWAVALAALSMGRAPAARRRPAAPEVMPGETPARTLRVLVGVVVAASLAIAALQQTGQGSIAASASTFIVVSFLPGRVATWAGVAVTAALGAVTLAQGLPAGDAAANMLLCAVLGVAGFFVRRASEHELETEVLLAELEDARDAQAEAAAAEERRRIAAELHDVLAHALSGAAIQLEGARALATREAVSPRLAETVGRAGELVRAGLVDARRAVEALRGDPLPGLAEVPALVEAARRDHGAAVTLTADADVPPVSAEAGLALYRGVQEALTNAHRHAPGAPVTVGWGTVVDGGSIVRLTVVNGPADRSAPPSPGGGHGLDGLRERVARVGGTAQAGPTGDGGWRVTLEVPA